MCEQMEMLRKMIEESRTRTTEGKAKLVKLMEQDDIESYITQLTMFERIAPQLTGNSAAMKADDDGNYQLVKEAILSRYDI